MPPASPAPGSASGLVWTDSMASRRARRMLWGAACSGLTAREGLLAQGRWYPKAAGTPARRGGWCIRPFQSGVAPKADGVQRQRHRSEVVLVALLPAQEIEAPIVLGDGSFDQL